MARILIVTGGLSGMLFSSLELARRLRGAGHVVTFASDRSVEATVRSQELDFVTIEPAPYQRFREVDRRWPVLERARTVGARRRGAVDAAMGAGLASVLRSLRPDLVLVDVELHEHVLVALGNAARVALLNPFVSIWRRPGLPPPHHLVVPGRGLRGSAAGMWLLWEALRARKALRRLCQAVSRLGADRVSTLRALAEEVDVPFRRLADFGQWLMPLTWRELPALTLHGRELELPHEPRPGVQYLGPLVLRRRPQPELGLEDRDRLEALLGRLRRGEEERHLIYAGFGSFFSTDVRLVRNLVDCVGTRDDWLLVLSLGGSGGEVGASAEARWWLEQLPDNVVALPWAPQVEILEHADVAVVHGGTHTAEECVAAGVPMLVYCGHETDMAGTTSRILFHGLGLAGDPGDDAERMERRLDRLFEDRSIANNIERMRARLRRSVEERLAERAVEALLPEPRESRRSGGGSEPRPGNG